MTRVGFKRLPSIWLLPVLILPGLQRQLGTAISRGVPGLFWLLSVAPFAL
jgi:hypothetical protein